MTPAPRTCREPNCDRPPYVRGLCSRHYQQARRANALQRHRIPTWRDELHALAETPGLTLTEYTRRKHEILARHNQQRP